jgi:hypothetical protein
MSQPHLEMALAEGARAAPLWHRERTGVAQPPGIPLPGFGDGGR